MTPKKRVVAIFLVGLMILSSMALSGCTTEESDGDGKTLFRMGFAFPTEVDPCTSIDFSSITAQLNLYDPLVHPTPSGVEPWIAEDWESSNDGKTWTFYIKEGLEFHSGNEITAEDVLYSMKRMAMMGSGFGYLFYGTVNLEESEVVDEYTVRFELEKEMGVFLDKCIRLSIFDKELVEEHTEYGGDFEYGDYGDFGRAWLKSNDAGSGPYELVEVTTDHVIMEKNEDYWGPMNEDAPDEFRLLALADPSTERTLFAEDELEATSEWIDYEIKQILVDQEGGKLGAYQQAGMRFGFMHNQRKPLDCVHVRKALLYAIDYETLRNDIFPSLTPAKGLVAETMYGFYELDMPERDLELAQAELEKSKYYPDIVENPDEYEIDYIWMGAVPATERQGIELAKNAEDIGLKINVQKQSWGQIVDNMLKKDTSPDIVPMQNDAHYGEAGAFLKARYHSVNAPNTQNNEWLLNETLDKMIEDALNETDRQERFELYEQIQKEIHKKYTSIICGQAPSTHVYQPYVTWPQMEGDDSIPAAKYYIEVRKIGVTPVDER